MKKDVLIQLSARWQGLWKRKGLRLKLSSWEKKQSGTVLAAAAAESWVTVCLMMTW